DPDTPEPGTDSRPAMDAAAHPPPTYWRQPHEMAHHTRKPATQAHLTKGPAHPRAARPLKAAR
ncbi:hypothetical protein, partial [Streptomyces regalis]|uniref:hypothetical protein n=1 Tax=Streptomyces regalis TaxID=68262 RepID=UPI000AF4FA0F